MKKYFGIVLAFMLMLGSAVAINAQKANPASDFKYDLNSEGTGVVIQKYKGTATEVVIPSVIEEFPVVTIGGEAFMRTKVVSVVIPDSIVDIAESNDYYNGDRACFVECESLEKIILPKNLTSIPKFCFYKCKALKEIIFSECMEMIGEHAFYKCKSITTINMGDSVKFIRGWAFSDCTALTTVTIGSGISVIGRGAFYGCSSLSKVDIGIEKLEKKMDEWG